MKDTDSTAHTAIPKPLIDQVIGQERAAAVVRLAAQQKRFVLLIGDPGTGKSLLGRAIAELLPESAAYCVASLPHPQHPSCPRIVCKSRETLEQEARHGLQQERLQQRSQQYFLGFIAAAILLVSLWLVIRDQSYGYGLAGAIALVWLWQHKPSVPAARAPLPKILVDRPRGPAPFIDATACSEGALFGDVRHDPYQSGGQETPPHHLVEPGAVHRAHGGVLYIDEIGSLSAASQKLLLTAIQDKALPITGRQSGSSGTLIRSEPLPCDFVLVAAGNVEDLPQMSPALRSRILGFGFEVLTESSMADTSAHHQDIWRFIAQEVHKDGRIPHFQSEAVERIIDEARRRTGETGRLSTRFRELGGLIRIAGDLAVQTGAALVQASHVRDALSYAASIEEQQTTRRQKETLNVSTPAAPARFRHSPAARADR